MKECPHCHKDIPNDSVYCYHCGKAVDDIVESKNDKQEKKLKKNPRPNSWGKLGMLLFFVGMLVFDFIIGTVMNALGGNVKIPYIISMILYIGAMVCGVMSLYIDKQDLKKGYSPNGNKNYAYISIFLSLFVMLANLTQVILK